jgi:hypothetical protein
MIQQEQFWILFCYDTISLPRVPESLFSVANFSCMLENVPTLIPVHSLSWLKTDLQHGVHLTLDSSAKKKINHVLQLVSPLKLLEIANFSSQPVCRGTNSLCKAQPASHCV